MVDRFHINRVKRGMLEATKTNGVYHLWRLSHNFGQRTEANEKNLEQLLKYNCILYQEHGKLSLTMKELRES